MQISFENHYTNAPKQLKIIEKHNLIKNSIKNFNFISIPQNNKRGGFYMEIRYPPLL